ncbi:MAG TPA: DsbA family protein [Gemmatimonadales bacterium]|nr:DsbA family protein [Gemmatimonadales bacterium]
MLRGALVALVMAGSVGGTLVAQSKADSAKVARSRPDSTKAAATKADSTRSPLAGRIRGSAAAPVTVYEMSDFQCPYCREFAIKTFPAIDSAYVATGRVRWAFVNFPLTSIHHNAVPAAEVALCAAQQGGFWRVHDLLYRHQDVWAPLKEPAAFFLTLADSAKLSKPALLACLQSPATEEAIRADAQGAQRSGANSTPTFYIEGGLLVGAQPLPVFRQVLDSILKGRERR